ncbi:MAG: hypothetical protein ABSB49_21070 [Polyangia bacterium]|jgi:hypothetical protein
MSNHQGRNKQEQTVPLIFQRVRSRVTREVSMPAKTGEELARYIKWACEAVGADQDEAMILVMEQALGQFFARDRLFQEALRAGEDSERSKETARPPAGAKPAAAAVPGGGGGGPSALASGSGSASPASAPGKGAPSVQPATTRPPVTQ